MKNLRIWQLQIINPVVMAFKKEILIVFKFKLTNFYKIYVKVRCAFYFWHVNIFKSVYNVYTN